MTIGEKIRNKRIGLNMSQVELAEKTHSSKQTIYKYENEIITNIPLDKVELIANALEITPAYLMGWEDNLNEESEDVIVDIMSDNELLAYVKKINSFSKSKKIKLYGYIDCLSEMED